MDKITISIKDGIASIINLSPKQAQEILDKYIKNKNKKVFSQEELYDYLQYFMYCQYYEQEFLECKTFEKYQRFLKESKIHMGDCTKDTCSCLKCQLQKIEIKAQKALKITWQKITVGHCGKICLKECEGIK